MGAKSDLTGARRKLRMTTRIAVIECHVKTDLADRFFTAIEQEDYTCVIETFALDAVIWHNGDPTDMLLFEHLLA